MTGDNEVFLREGGGEKRVWWVFLENDSSVKLFDF